MFLKHGGLLANVDSQISPIDRELYAEEFDAYLAKVQRLTAAVHQAPNIEQPAFKNVRDKLLEFTAVDIGAQGSVRLQEGFLRVVGLLDDGALKSSKMADWRLLLAAFQPPLVHLHCVDPEFVTLVAMAMLLGVRSVAP